MADRLNSETKKTPLKFSAISGPFVFFVGMWLVFASAGCLKYLSSGVPVVPSILAGVVGGFVLSFVTALFSPFGNVPLR